MAITRFDLLIDTDNNMQITGLKDNNDDTYINDATPVEMSLFKLPKRKRVWILTPNAAATVGTWTLTYLGETTAAIQWDANLWEIQAALEALTTIQEGDITVSGELISVGTAGLVIEFASSWKDVEAITFDFDTNLTGPTDALSTIVKKTQNLFAGAVTDKGGGKVGIPVIRHEAVSGDFIKIEGSKGTLDGEYTVDATTSADEIVVTAVFADVTQTMTGRETYYIGITNGTEIAMSYVAASDGDYRGVLPSTLKGLVQNELVNTSRGQVEIGAYPLFAKAVKAGSQRTWQLLGVAKFG